MDENERRRQTAHEAWLLQLTPEQRGEYELAHMGEVMEASPEVLEAAELLLPDTSPKLREVAERERRFTRVGEVTEANSEALEATEALQRAIERRD